VYSITQEQKVQIAINQNELEMLIDQRVKKALAKQPKQAADKRLINRRELEQLASISRPTITRWVASGILPKPRKINSVNYWRLDQVQEALDV
jgi:predicted DNA-binding transcriptional regulator AlpA